jgi:hypothetical protein
MSIWATAPFLHNNSLGLFNNDPSVDGRLEAFDDAIRKLLWPAKRLESSSYNGATAERLQRDHGLIWRTPQTTYLALDAKRVPHFAQRLPLITSLYEYDKLRWLKSVQPLWLPSGILMVGALITLLVSNASYRRQVAYGVLGIAALTAGLYWLIGNYPEISLGRWLRELHPWWLAPVILAVIGLGLRPLTRGSTTSAGRLLANGLVALALLLAIVTVCLQVLPDLTLAGWLRDIVPWWLPWSVLLAIGVVLWLPVSRIWTRRLGYLQIGLSLLLGGVIYFNAGNLGDLQLGPIPAGTPVNLLANFNSEADRATQIKSLHTTLAGLAEIDSRHLDGADAEGIMKKKIAPALMAVNKCPDFVMDRGHYFPWFDNMSDQEKNALIELLKTL